MLPFRVNHPRTTSFVICFLASLFAIGSALYVQYGLSHKPCELCLLERYPYGFIILLSALGVSFREYRFFRHILMALILCLLLTEFSMSLYHLGLEQTWWVAAEGCTSPAFAALDQDLENVLRNTRPQSCEVATFFIFGLSLVAYNTLYSFSLLILMGIFYYRHFLQPFLNPEES